MIEIERKYLLKTLDLDLSKLHYVNIQQGYLSSDPVVRVRISEQGPYIGVKGPGTISRVEKEYKIPLEDAEYFIQISPGKILKKRYFYPVGKHKWEIDIFEGSLAGLILVEIELEHEDEAFEMPPFMKDAKEVTEDTRYTNAELSKTGSIPCTIDWDSVADTALTKTEYTLKFRDGHKESFPIIKISRSDAIKKIHAYWDATGYDNYKYHSANRRNYEYEGDLEKAFGPGWVIDEPCPGNGFYSSYGTIHGLRT